MVSSITTLGTPHNGTHASDVLGNEAVVRQVVYDIGKALVIKIQESTLVYLNGA